MSLRDALVIGVMALAVLLPKVLPLWLLPGDLPVALRRWLRYVAPAVLAALVAPAVLAPRGALGLPGWEQAGYLAAFALAVVTRRMLPALAAGLGVVFLGALLGG